MGDQARGIWSVPVTSWRSSSTSRIHAWRSPLWTCRASRSQALPGGRIAHGGDRDDVVGEAAPVGMVRVPQEPGVVAPGKERHPPSR